MADLNEFGFLLASFGSSINLDEYEDNIGTEESRAVLYFE